MNEQDMKREDGFYWVKYDDRWEPAQWFEGGWYLIHSLGLYKDEWFDEIGPRLEGR